ncbi:S8 family serine peptidase [bacterium]|nr:S8 family serine peptidase [bacterium]
MPLSINRLVIIASILTLGLAGCSKPEEQSSVAPQHKDELFSDRPVSGLSTEVILIELNEPAILETNGTQENINAVLTEQSDFESRLRSLSAEIKVLYRYRFTVNGLAIVTPAHLIPEIQKNLQAKTVEKTHFFSRPQSEIKMEAGPQLTDDVTSVSYIGGTTLHKLGLRGQGMKVGVIDTGVDYTHAMLGGSGNKDLFKAIDPNTESVFFPNKKVVGGIDLAGSRYTGRSDLYDQKVPLPDSNPIDEAGHGTHVAGTIAGLGDGKNTYDGVAPDASIYAIKVFGKDGGTTDSIVIAGLEYAMDPNGDLNTDDRLDVVNLSLGGGFGTKKILYSKAIENISKSGMVVVAAAGNAGDLPGVVGAPSTANDAISVAASIDGRKVNWEFPTVKFNSENMEEIVAEFKEGSFTQPVEEVTALSGPLVFIGLADKELDEETKAKLKGKIALIERGGVPFVEKFKVARDAGAIGGVVFNNQDGEPIQMGVNDDDSFKIAFPGIMVSKAVGLALKQTLEKQEVIIDFKSSQLISKPELIDSITSFSSRGPRSDDYGFKPEIAAPGNRILSAAMGSGSEGAMMNGTSMAAPHIAGAVALIKQMHSEMSPKEIKDILASTAVKLTDATTNSPYKFTSQGAGRVNLEKLANADFYVTGHISLGLVQVPGNGLIEKTLHLKNISTSEMLLTTSFEGTDLQVQMPNQIQLAPGEAKDITLQFRVAPGNLNLTPTRTELNGTIKVSSQKETLDVSVLAFRIPKSQIQLGSLSVTDQTIGKSQDKMATLTLENTSPVIGGAYLFNLIGEDEKKSPISGQEWRADDCDLKTVGYRWTTKFVGMAQVPHIQFVFQLYEPRSQLVHCQLSILVDGDKDGQPDQEIVGFGNYGEVQGVGQVSFIAGILDYKKAQEARLQYEISVAQGKEAKFEIGKYGIAGGDLLFGSESGLIVFDVPVSAIMKSPDASFNAKIAALNTVGDALESDDYLGDDETQWRTLTTNRFDMGYWGMEDLNVPGNSSASMRLVKSTGTNPLIMVSPSNTKDKEVLKVTP